MDGPPAKGTLWQVGSGCLTSPSSRWMASWFSFFCAKLDSYSSAMSDRTGSCGCSTAVDLNTRLQTVSISTHLSGRRVVVGPDILYQ